MPRPQKKRSVRRPPVHSHFKPTGIPARQLEALELTLDEFEAIRLADYRGLDHQESADGMGISRSTFSRLIERARTKLARFLVEGMFLRIEGGEIHFQDNLIRCADCGHLAPQRFDNEEIRCPECGSGNLIDLAGGFGHGRCCQRHHRNRRR